MGENTLRESFPKFLLRPSRLLSSGKKPYEKKQGFGRSSPLIGLYRNVAFYNGPAMVIAAR